MKSPMVTGATYIKPEDKSGYSDLQVLSSGAGYYVGTLYTDPVNGFCEPGSRDSDYFRTEEQAKAFLDAINQTDEGIAAIVLRNHP